MEVKVNTVKIWKIPPQFIKKATLPQIFNVFKWMYNSKDCLVFAHGNPRHNCYDSAGYAGHISVS